MVRQRGLEETLQALHRAGVHVTFEEFKGRRPIVRGGEVIPGGPHAFANPLLNRHFEARTGASRSLGATLFIDLRWIAEEAAAHALFLQAFELWDRPMGLWRPLPPGVAGLMNALRQTRAGRRVSRWFTQNSAGWDRGTWKNTAVGKFLVAVSQLCGKPLPTPVHVPVYQAQRVAQWLAARRRSAVPAWLDTNASSGVRVCQAALERGLDIAGTFFVLGGEPFTPAKASAIAAADCRAVSHYSMTEVGRIGVACGAAANVGDVHLLTNKLAVIPQETKVGRFGKCVPALALTTLQLRCPLVLVNVLTDDYAVLEERACGCPLEAVGLRQHLHTIRSYEKLNSEGMTFLGHDLYRVLEEVLPARFGGEPTDYQLVETEDGGLPRVSIVIDPRVGPVVEDRVVATALDALRRSADGSMMADCWQQAQTLRVVRRLPYATQAAKILPLHVLSGRET
jgi:hypothetical protein